MRDQSYFSKKVTFLNVMLTIFIVLLHAETPLRFGVALDKSYPFIYSVFTLVQLGVPMFFFISAVLFFKQCTFADLEKKYERRIFSLLIPYLLWNTIFVIVYVILLHIPFIQERMHMSPDILDTPREILGAIIQSRCTPLWFVKDLMLLTLLAPVILLLLKDMRWMLVAFIVSLAIAVAGNYSYENIIIWIPVYLQGAVVGHSSFQSGSYRSLDSIIQGKYGKIFLCVVLMALLAILYVFLYRDHSCIRVFRYCAPIVVWGLFDFLFRDYINNKFVVKSWMNYMFIIYCMHHFILNVLQKIISTQFAPTRIILNLTYIATPIITVLIIICISQYMSRFSFYKYFSGGR